MNPRTSELVICLIAILLMSGCNETETPAAPGHQNHDQDVVLESVCTPPPPGMVSWWPGDGDASDIQDGNDGNIFDITFEPGLVDGAFRFDSDSDLLNVGSADNLDDITVKTFDLWINPTAYAATRPVFGAILQKTDPFADQGWGIYFRGNEQRLEYFQGVTSNQFLLWNTPAGSFSTDRFNTWTHIAVVHDNSLNSNDPIIYIDGVQQAVTRRSPIPSGTPTTDAPYDLTIGGNVARTHGAGALIDEVELFDRALSAAEIQAIYNAGSFGKCKSITVSIDIKPGSYPNSINPRSKGVIPVAVLSTESFNATTVDPATATFGPGEASPAHEGHLEDVDGDGDTDLVLHFRTQETGIQCGEVVATLKGLTLDGRSLLGSDSIKTTGCR